MSKPNPHVGGGVFMCTCTCAFHGGSPPLYSMLVHPFPILSSVLGPQLHVILIPICQKYSKCIYCFQHHYLFLNADTHLCNFHFLLKSKLNYRMGSTVPHSVKCIDNVGNIVERNKWYFMFYHLKGMKDVKKKYFCHFHCFIPNNKISSNLLGTNS